MLITESLLPKYLRSKGDNAYGGLQLGMSRLLPGRFFSFSFLFCFVCLLRERSVFLFVFVLLLCLMNFIKICFSYVFPYFSITRTCKTFTAKV